MAVDSTVLVHVVCFLKVAKFFLLIRDPKKGQILVEIPAWRHEPLPLQISLLLHEPPLFGPPLLPPPHGPPLPALDDLNEVGVASALEKAKKQKTLRGVRGSASALEHTRLIRRRAPGVPLSAVLCAV